VCGGRYAVQVGDKIKTTFFSTTTIGKRIWWLTSLECRVLFSSALCVICFSTHFLKNKKEN
jgi:hypothetical protein